MSAPAAVREPALGPEPQTAASAVPGLRDAGDVVHLRRPAGPLGRAAALFVEPRIEPAPDPPPPSPPYVAPRAAVLGRRTEALPLAAALANALRAGHAAAAVAAWSPDRDSAAAVPAWTADRGLWSPDRDSAAAVAAWSPDRDSAAAVAAWSPGRDSAAPEPAPALAADAVSGPATPPRGPEPTGGFPALPAAARLATRLTGRGLTAVARGRLAWLELPAHPLAAAPAARRANAAVDAPLVLVVAGPRCDALDVLLGEQDLIVVVTDEPDGPLARLAIEASPVPAVACPPLGGPARLLALAGLAGRRALAANLRAAREGGP